jgi:hypothetical protein
MDQSVTGRIARDMSRSGIWTGGANEQALRAPRPCDDPPRSGSGRGRARVGTRLMVNNEAGGLGESDAIAEAGRTPAGGALR